MGVLVKASGTSIIFGSLPKCSEVHILLFGLTVMRALLFLMVDSQQTRLWPHFLLHVLGSDSKSQSQRQRPKEA